ncbi:V8-like Glu-specific endopeptidase [Thermoactinomyces sp. DSM 45891]|uniref:trypsin-like serine peptidase n=1 Tax=Thermoactinomyces sp. DSM 45891 TaxID=1761907 RepID=UPI00091832F5|nr:trypsin-like peptidase domain-containing protein [Thermoactinomyces sp. DSM 45891]SFX79626.1 V8-like Glu-specific endopeptidase [Thermoactinomyces sp. DSM 45891]
MMRKVLFTTIVTSLVSLPIIPSPVQPKTPTNSFVDFSRVALKDLPKAQQEQLLKIANEAKKQKKFTLKKEGKPDINSISQETLQSLPSGTSISSDGSIEQVPLSQESMEEGIQESQQSSSKIIIQGSPKDLSKVINTSLHPNSAIATLMMSFDDGHNPDDPSNYYLCTGFHVDEDTVITASHCVWDIDRPEGVRAANSIMVVRALNGVDQPYPASYTDAFWVNSDFPKVKRDSNKKLDPTKVAPVDFAAIRVDQKSDSSLNIRSTKHAVGEQVLAHGYPAESPEFLNKGLYQYNSLGKLTDLYSQYMITNQYTEGGMSGGPMWNSKAGVVAAISLNSLSDRDSIAYGPRFTGKNYDLIKYWMKK